MIFSTQLTTTGDTAVYYSTNTGLVGGTGQHRAITTMIVCNTTSPDETDELTDGCNLTMNICGTTSPNNVSTAANTIVKDLLIPPGETVFFSDEKIILGPGDSIRATASIADHLSITISTMYVGSSGETL